MKYHSKSIFTCALYTYTFTLSGLQTDFCIVMFKISLTCPIFEINLSPFYVFHIFTIVRGKLPWTTF